MRNEERKLSRELGWIIGLGLLGVLAGSFYDLGLDDKQADAAQDPIGYLLGSGYSYGCFDTTGYSVN